MQILNNNKRSWPKNWGEKTSIMGIMNLTPDSFSDGGEISNISKALEQINNFVSSGLDVLDIGAQSTRPGAVEVGSEIELKRLIPILKEIRLNYPELLISVDTFNSDVAFQALSEGANWINDVTGGRRDEKILDVVSEFECPFVITHSKGNSQNMNDLSRYEDLINETIISLMELTDKAINKNISENKLIWDPGLGFSKDTEQNIDILKNLKKYKSFGFPLLIGASRKRFIGEILKEENPKNRDIGTLAITCLCSSLKIEIVRVHNVDFNYQLLKVADKIFRN